jgi:hypothetical protein
MKSVVILSVNFTISNKLVEWVNSPLLDCIEGVLNKYRVYNTYVYILTKSLSLDEFETKLKNVYQLTGLLIDRFVIICCPKISKSVKVYANRIASRQSTKKISFFVTNIATSKFAQFWCWPGDRTSIKEFERYYCEELQSVENILCKIKSN